MAGNKTDVLQNLDIGEKDLSPFTKFLTEMNSRINQQATETPVKEFNIEEAEETHDNWLAKPLV